jgi:hypothetical protein
MPLLNCPGVAPDPAFTENEPTFDHLTGEMTPSFNWKVRYAPIAELPFVLGVCSALR